MRAQTRKPCLDSVFSEFSMTRVEEENQRSKCIVKMTFKPEVSGFYHVGLNLQGRNNKLFSEASILSKNIPGNGHTEEVVFEGPGAIEDDSEVLISVLPFRPAVDIQPKFIVIHTLSCLFSPFVREQDGPVSKWIRRFHYTETPPTMLSLMTALSWSSEDIQAPKKSITFSILVRDIIRKISNECGSRAKDDEKFEILVESRPVPRVCGTSTIFSTFQETDASIICFLPVFTANWEVPASFTVNDIEYVCYAVMDDKGKAYAYIYRDMDQRWIYRLAGLVERLNGRPTTVSEVFSAAFYIKKSVLEKDGKSIFWHCVNGPISTK